MPWNLFEKIISAFRHGKSSEQPSDEPNQSQQWPEGNSQQWPEGNSQQPQDSQEPSPAYQQAPNTPQENDRQYE